MLAYAFVLAPRAEIAPAMRHPVAQCTFANMSGANSRGRARCAASAMRRTDDSGRSPAVNFCSQCAAPVSAARPPRRRPAAPRLRRVRDHSLPESEDRGRDALPEYEGRILLCRRAIEPRAGLWTLPAGFMENGETIEEAAARETRLKRANARLEVDGLLHLPGHPPDQPGLRHVPRPYRGPAGRSPRAPRAWMCACSTKPRSRGTKSRSRPSTRTLELWFQDRRNGAFGIHTGVIHRRAAH